MATPTPRQAAFLTLLTAVLALGALLGITMPGSPIVGPDPSTPSATPTPTPTGSPTPTDTPTSHSVKMSVVAWNEKSYPRMTQASYQHDLLDPVQSGWVKAPATAYLLAEFNSNDGEEQMAKQWASDPSHHLRIRPGYNETPTDQQDTLEAFDSSLKLYVTHAKVYHAKVAGPASPERRYVATWANVGGFHVVFVALHTTNGCLPNHKSDPWYQARCKALQEEEDYIRTNLVQHEVANGWTVVVGGDVNTDNLIVWDKSQVATKPNDLMQTAVIPAKGVNVVLNGMKVIPRLSKTGLLTDHTTTDASFTLTD